MDAALAYQGDADLILVRLSQVSKRKRQVVAQRIIRTEGLVGVPMLEMILAAENPRQDPALLVDPAKAEAVLR